MTLSCSAIPKANMAIVTDDNIAKLTVKSPPSGLANLTVCVGKPDPVPAGVAQITSMKSRLTGHMTASSARNSR